ncbi:ABC transporter permease [Streptomyces malaysiensis]|uniref:ABC transporter permease n=1 Tax=Streptomyces malaysiensis subsp. samsunensis TaxID=459658 RepID=A0A9X2RTA0_STRMQ|nr:ABC transporter permease [Streptomyces samsunensis]MCQ8830037.1 ABC transporter permease [Streptomyces samsunensis]
MTARLPPGLPRYLVRRLCQAVFVIWAAFTVTSLLLYLLPSDPVQIMIGPQAHASPGQLARLRHEYGLDRPVVTQYVTQLGRALHGDLGQSIQSGVPVITELFRALPHTLALAGASLGLGAMLGGSVAWSAAYASSPRLRAALLAVPSLFISVPTFWLGLMLMELFSFTFRAFPASGGTGFASLVLPAVTLAIPSAAFIAQTLGSELIKAMGEPYADTARAKGASRSRVLRGHALRNAVMPTLTMLGLLVGWQLSGSVVVETVFARDGIGRLTEAAVRTQDIPMVQGLVLLAAVCLALVNLAVDLVYPLADPRVLVRRPAVRSRQRPSARAAAPAPGGGR